jgi:hypothetical protein
MSQLPFFDDDGPPERPITFVLAPGERGTHPAIRAAMMHLRSVCDGATTQDLEGFSGADAPYGHRMAAELAAGRELDPDEQQVAREILWKYHATQLQPAGVELPTPAELARWLGVPEEDGAAPAVRRRVLDRLKVKEAERTRGQRAAEELRRDQERAERRADERRRIEEGPDMTVGLAPHGQPLIEFDRRHPRFRDSLEIARALPRRSFVQVPRTGWQTDTASLAHLLRKTAEAGIRVEWRDGLEEIARRELAALDAREAAAPKAADGSKPEVTITGGANPAELWIEFDFGPRFNEIKEAVKGVEGRRFTMDPRPHWTIPTDRFDELMRALRPFKVGTHATASDVVQRHVEERRRRQEQEDEERQRAAEERARIERERAEQGARVLAAIGDLTAPFEYAPPGFFPETRTLFKHQREGIERMIREAHRGIQRGAINADDMGLGKTCQALFTAKAFTAALGTRTLVVCPVSLKDNWLREAAALGVEIEVYSSAKIPEPPAAPYILIADEAHQFQTWGEFAIDKKTGEEKIKGTQRTARFIRLAEAAVAVFPLTGTPMRNGRPIEAYPLLHAVRHELADDRKAYEKRYCGAHLAQKGRATVYDVTGAAHMDEWFARTKDVIIRRLKKQCLDMPEKTRVFRTVEISAEARRHYNETLTVKAKEYYERVEQGRADRQRIQERADRELDRIKNELEIGRIGPAEAKELTRTVEEQAREESRETFSEEGEALVLLTHLRLASSTAKVDSAIELAEAIIAEGRSVILFTEFAQSAAALGSHFSVPVLDGSTPSTPGPNGEPSARQRMVDDFQAGRTRVFVGTIKAGGVGITLHAAADVILVDRPWTPGDAVQAEDRAHRLGQRNAVTTYWLQAFEIDEKIDEILTSKHERIELLLAGKRKTLRGVKQMSRAQMAQELLPHFLDAANRGAAR